MAAANKASFEEAFGSLLRSYRKAHGGLSQERLGQDIGSGRTYMSELERGFRNPSLKIVFRLARQLGVRPSTMIRRLEDSLGPIDDLDLD